jgi:glycosyltransferase involved in cell wall biosynthesis
MSESESVSSNRRVLSLVLPCFNESEAIRPVLRRIINCVQIWRAMGTPIELAEVIVIDDASTDSSEEKLQQELDHWRKQGLSTELRTMRHDVRQGYGGALKTGFALARSPWIGFYDVDATYDPSLLPEMMKCFSAHDVHMVCGDRLSRVEHMPLTREIGNKIFVATINLLFGSRVFDSCTGMRVFDRKVLPVFIRDEMPDTLDYSLAMTLHFLSQGYRLVEVPIPYSRRIGQSKLQVMVDGPRFFLRIVGTWIRLKVRPKVQGASS